MQAIAGRHPERPSDVNEAQYQACRIFLAHFAGETRNLKPNGGKDLRANIYTLNYDLLLYWTLLHDQVIDWNATDPLASLMKTTEALQHDDGFCAPDEDPEAAYVAWEGEETHPQTIYFLRGALHIYDYGHELQKKCWERSGGIPLVDQIRASLNDMKDGFRFLFRKEAPKENLSVSGIQPICIKGCVALLKFAVLQEPAFLFSVTLWLPMIRIF